MTNDTILERVKGAFTSCGLAKAQMHKDPNGAESFLVRSSEGYKCLVDAYFRFEFDHRKLSQPDEAEREIVRGLRPLYESLRASPWVKDLEDRLAAAEKEVARLQPYQTYYDMAYQLQQGQKPG